MSLSLNYLVVGDNPDRIFTVEISKNKNISILKKLIKVEKARHFRVEHVDASDLELWQVSFLIDDLEKELGNINLARHPKLLSPSKKLATFFTDGADDCLHVIAKAPGTSRPSSLPPPLPRPPSPLSLSLFDPGTAATSPSPLLRDVGWPFFIGWGLHTKGGPVKWEAR